MSEAQAATLRAQARYWLAQAEIACNATLQAECISRLVQAEYQLATAELQKLGAL